MNNFFNILDNLIDQLDKFSYSKLIDCLKLTDPIAFHEALVHIIDEKKKSAIPIIYLCWKKHPNPTIRKYSLFHLSKLENLTNLEKFLEENHQDIQKNVEKLIIKYDCY